MSGPRLLRELRRRHVVRVAVAYAAAAWLVLQLASMVLPTFGAPAWVLKVVMGLVALFFPIALVLAWAFEMTPEGVRRTVPEGEEAARAPEVGRSVGRTLNRVTIAVLLVAVAVLGWKVFVLGRGGSAASDRSVAVLPFESLSSDSSNAYFASGMQDMILTKLAGVGDLKVISRTSTEQYGSKPENLRAIGRALGVGAILEGSVQRANNQVLVNVQLIDARTDHHLWADDYTRTLDNVFGVESEVAEKVAAALRATLTPSERRRVSSPPTTDPAAYDLYLQADAHARRAYDNNSLVDREMPPAIALYREALARDSSFALAAAALGSAHMNLYWFGPDRTDARLAAAKVAIDRALALEPDLGEGHFALALYDYWGHRDYAGALDELDLARKTLPNSAIVMEYLAAVARRQGQWDVALDAFRRSTLLDPRRPDLYAQLGLTYSMLRRYARADSAFLRSLSVSHDSLTVHTAIAFDRVVGTGDPGPMRALAGKTGPGSPGFRTWAASFYEADWLARDFVGALSLARSDSSATWATPTNVALPRELFVAWALEATGDSAGARNVYADVRGRMAGLMADRPDDPDLLLALAFADAGLGDREAALREGRRAASLIPPSRDAVTGTEFLKQLARIYVRVGEKAQAIDALHRLATMPAGLVVTPALLRLDPDWDPLRSDPRFQALLRLSAAEPGTPATDR